MMSGRNVMSTEDKNALELLCMKNGLVSVLTTLAKLESHNTTIRTFIGPMLLALAKILDES